VTGLALLATIDPSTAYAVLLGSMVLVGTGLGVANGSVRGERGAERVVVWAGAGAAVGLAAASMAFLVGQARERDDGGSFEHALSTGVGWAACALILVLGVAAALAWRAMPASSPARPAGAS
jgi:hypothetical protein